MTNNANLVRTPIVDKNGKQTTVLRKPQKATGATTLPAPSNKASETTREAVVARVALMVTSILEYTEGSGAQELETTHAMIDQLHSAEFLIDMERYLGSSGSERIGVAEQLAYGESERPILESLHFHALLENANYTRTAAQVEGLRFYQVAPSGSDLRHGDEDAQSKLVSLLKITNAIETSFGDKSAAPGMNHDRPLRHIHTSFMGQPVHEIRNPELVQLAKEQSDNADQIVDIITKYRTVDPHAIRGILNGVTPSLAVGSL